MKTEDELRAAKAAMVKTLVKAQESVGMVPDTQAADRFVAPILDRIDQQAEEKAKRDEKRANACAVPEIDPDVKVIKQDIGDYEWDLKTDVVTPTRQLTPTEIMAQIIYKLRQLPDWRAKLDRTLDMCKRHAIGGVQPSCTMCERREAAFRKVLAQAAKKFGNPFRKKDPKIFVGGGKQ